MPPSARLLGFVTLAVVGIGSAELLVGTQAPKTASASSLRLLTASPPSSYQAAVARADLNVEAAVKRSDERADEWLVHEATARAYFDRARLSGSFADYAAAQAWLDRAFAATDGSVGPHLLQAVIAFSLHRLALSEQMLDKIDAYAVPPSAADRAELMGIRGDIAFYRGRYSAALQFYRQANALSDGTADFRLAIYQSQMGDRARASRYFDSYERRMGSASPRQRAEIALQRGILDLDYGRLDEALRHFRRADTLFPDHWLIEEHIAEVLTLQGNLEAAEPVYRSIVRRTGHPEYVDALANIARARGDAPAADRLTRAAAEQWSRRIRQLPEAAYGHAIDHCLHARKAKCALRLAELNHRNRPYGEAKLKLAQAMLLNGAAPEAASLLEAVKRSGWRRDQVNELLGALRKEDSAAGAEQRQLSRGGRS